MLHQERVTDGKSLYPTTQSRIADAVALYSPNISSAHNATSLSIFIIEIVFPSLAPYSYAMSSDRYIDCCIARKKMSE